jgi:hypothetical protein
MTNYSQSQKRCYATIASVAVVAPAPPEIAEAASPDRRDVRSHFDASDATVGVRASRALLMLAFDSLTPRTRAAENSVAQPLHPGNGLGWTPLDDRRCFHHRIAQQKRPDFSERFALFWTHMDFYEPLAMTVRRFTRKTPKSDFESSVSAIPPLRR